MISLTEVTIWQKSGAPEGAPLLLALPKF